MPLTDIRAPGRFVPLNAIAFGANASAATPVDLSNPLPVTSRQSASSSTALVGSTGASAVRGPFTPEIGRPIWLTLSGTWTGTATLRRSVDGGATMQGLTAGGAAWAVFTANANEPVAEENDAAATYYLDIQIVSGTLAYRVSQ